MTIADQPGTDTHDVATRGGPSARTAARVVATVAVVSLAVNLLVFAVSRLAGTDFVVSAGGAAPAPIGVTPVVVATVAPLLLAGVLLAVASRWGRRAWTALAWAGLVFAVLSIAASATSGGNTATVVSLALMHLSVGGAWFVLVRRAARAA